MAREATKRRGRPRGRAYGPDALRERYQELEARVETAAAIYAALVAEFPDHAPSDVRTVQRWVREDRTGDRTPPWRIAMSAVEDVPLIFGVIDALIRETGGRVRWVTEGEAQWIVRISKLAEPLRGGDGRGGWDALTVYAHARAAARADAIADDPYQDVALGIALSLIGAVGLGRADDLREWVDRGP